MSLELWLVYLAAALGLSLTPGPNGLLALTHGARFGLRPAAWTVLGGAVGFLFLIAASLAGLGALLAASGTAFTAAKWAGAAYLVYLGVRLWRSPAPVVVAAQASGLPGGRAARPLRLFGDGFLVAVSNPKALLFFAAFLPQFMVPGDSFAVQLLFLGGTFVAVEIAYELLLAGLAGRISPWLGRHGRVFNRAAGGTFIGIGAALATAGR
ncbi:LysE family translocator [Teichococcus oryzae]|uniref:LysE family translocator n=1 Tax=Teichococcus oryzae TaxID=1608942 RepID=A0A5B2TFY1_9PROT|nr:LysE family transporter [Pseudoroseomonas oryzae]KAA2213023.1 LysE family translocator [Pseudoroseomonas oryzae]